MATQTPNLGLVKPAGNERPLIGVLNGNADKIDAAIGDVNVTQDGSLQDQIDSIQDSVNHGFVVFEDIPANSYADKIITFANPMPSTPVVVATRTNSGTYGYNIQLGVTNGTSQNGFTLRCWNFSNEALGPQVAWIAVC